MGSLTHFADMRLVLKELNSIVTAFDFLEPVAPCLFAEMLRFEWERARVLSYFRLKTILKIQLTSSLPSHFYQIKLKIEAATPVKQGEEQARDACAGF